MGWPCKRSCDSAGVCMCVPPKAAGLTVMCAMGSSLPRLLMTEGLTLRPPVLRPMRSVRSMKLSSAVPIWVRQLQGRATRRWVGT